MKIKFVKINASEQDALYIKNLASDLKIPIKTVVERIVKLLKINEHLIKNEEYINIFDSTKFIDEIRKSFVKENNRILGFYLTTDKRIKELHSSMLYLLQADEKEAEKIHPFWSEYELQLNTFKMYLKTKYNIKNEDEILNELRSILTENQMKDYLLARERTRKRKLSIIRE